MAIDHLVSTASLNGRKQRNNPLDAKQNVGFDEIQAFSKKKIDKNFAFHIHRNMHVSAVFGKASVWPNILHGMQSLPALTALITKNRHRVGYGFFPPSNSVYE